ncbi:hypothetical protein ACP4OV_026300 [Aristida adscensionis]
MIATEESQEKLQEDLSNLKITKSSISRTVPDERAT